jgi:16S rRNA (guanine966-N2)-methyltransferase
MDPPYRKDLVAPTLKSLRDGGWLSTQALLVIETAKGENFDAEGYERLEVRDYGETEIAFLSFKK